MLTLKNNADQFKTWTKYTWLQATSKNFERLKIAPVLSNNFTKNLKKIFCNALSGKNWNDRNRQMIF